MLYSAAVPGTALTTFNKSSDLLQPKVIALRSMQHTSGDMLLNPPAYADFRAKVKINDKVSWPVLWLKVHPERKNSL